MRHRSPIFLLAAALFGGACAGDADRETAVVARVASVPSSDDASCRGAGFGTLDEVRRLAPLTDVDVARYLRVMGDAAKRRAQPTPEERDALATAEALQQRALTQGLAATAEAAIEANTVMARADTLRRHLDVLVARAQDGGAGCWVVLRDRIEAIVPSGTPGASGFYGDESDAPGDAAAEAAAQAAAQESAEDAELRRRLDALRAADSVVVTSRRAEIAAVIRGVRE